VDERKEDVEVCSDAGDLGGRPMSGDCLGVVVGDAAGVLYATVEGAAGVLYATGLGLPARFLVITVGGGGGGFGIEEGGGKSGSAGDVCESRERVLASDACRSEVPFCEFVEVDV
jgi:hypothetical protein